MVERSDLPPDVDRSSETRGASASTPGLNALDEEREASLADEGGASGATVESQDLDTLRRIASDLPGSHLHPDRGRSRRRLSGLALIAGAAAAGTLVALALRRR